MLDILTELSLPTRLSDPLNIRNSQALFAPSFALSPTKSLFFLVKSLSTNGVDKKVLDLVLRGSHISWACRFSGVLPSMGLKSTRTNTVLLQAVIDVSTEARLACFGSPVTC